MHFLLIALGLTCLAAALPLSEKQVDVNVDESEGEYGPYFEGDIELSEEELGMMTKQGLKSIEKRWPDKTLVYVISPEFDDEERQMIEEGIALITRKTCVKIIPRTNEVGYVNIRKGAGCSAKSGYQGEEQSMKLGEKCKVGSIAHEFIHALGIFHEQGRSDRDDYVTIVYGNIEEGKQHNFRKVDTETYDNFGTTYDYGSIMHYSRTAFGGPERKVTIIPKKEGVEIGQRKDLSEKDVKLINIMYDCQM